MSWSLELRNGDLTLSGAHLGTVTGGQKLAQDLRCAVLEQRGNDDMHTTFGSTIDGGRDPSGIEVQSVIGNSDWDYVSLRIQSEIQRLASEHQQRQLTRAQNDRYAYGASTLDNSELLVSVRSINMFQAQDTLIVQVELQTGSGQITPISIPVASGPIITN